MRFYEIDLLRGTAVIMMIFFHFLYDLRLFGVYSLESKFFWFYFPRLIVTIFLFLVGVSLTLSYSHVRPRKAVKKYLLRGLKIFSLGLLITLVTWLFIGKGFIIFGILHCIGLSIILAYPLLRYRNLNLYLGTAFIFLGWYLATFRFDFNWLIWLGFIPSGFSAMDYIPLLPWFGVVLLGLFFGHSLYPQGKRSFKIKEVNNRSIKLFSFLGRNSLFLYLVHQPILISLILLLS